MVQRDAGTQPALPPSPSQTGALRREEGLSSLAQERGGSVSSRLAGMSGIVGSYLNPGEIPAAPVEAAVIGDQYLIFTLLDRELAILAEHIQGVERLADVTPVPNVASWVKGVINLRGSIASVVDLRAFLDLEVLPHNPRTRLLSVRYNDMVVCLVVDNVSEMVPIPPTDIVTDPRLASIPQRLVPYAAGGARVGQRSVILIDVARLLFSERMQRYS
jgi:purine-binding chemotaxis protein CheW